MEITQSIFLIISMAFGLLGIGLLVIGILYLKIKKEEENEVKLSKEFEKGNKIAYGNYKSFRD